MTNNGKKIIRFQSKHQLNIGLIIFVLILIYIVYNVFLYFTTYRVAEYEVQEGVIASDNTYKGLIIRDETVVYSDHDGYINYYVKNGTKVAAADVIYTIDTKGTISSRITAAASTSESLDASELSSLVASMDKFSNSYKGVNYQNVSAFKADLSSELNQSLSNTALASLTPEIESAAVRNVFYEETAGSSGVITYYIDGMENLDTSTYEGSDLISTNYSRTSLEDNTEVKAGDPVYKLVNTETWYLIVPISSQTAQNFSETTAINVRFTKDDTTLPASCSIDKKEGQYYLSLKLRSGMIRYIGDRYEEVELIIGNTKGLKVPVSSLVTKDMYKIPAEYFKGSSNLYLRIRQTGNSIKEVYPTIYYYEDGYYYISNDVVSADDVIVSDDTLETYAVGTDPVTLDGVYEINKGYAVFRHVEITSSNDEYAIVKTGTNRGISLYDHIALDGSNVSESQTIIR